MGVFSWNCVVCGRSILNVMVVNRIEWSHATAVLPEGSIVHGFYDGYGYVGTHYLEDARASFYHTCCWIKAGRPPAYQGESAPAEDQGHFLGESWHDVNFRDFTKPWEVPDLSVIPAPRLIPYEPTREVTQADLVASLLEISLCMELDAKRSSWTARSNPSYLLTRLEEEVRELRVAWEKGIITDMQDELGDVLMMACVVAYKMGRVVDISSIGERVKNKLQRRKPWVFTGDRLRTPDEEREAWIGAKRLETKLEDTRVFAEDVLDRYMSTKEQMDEIIASNLCPECRQPLIDLSDDRVEARGCVGEGRIYILSLKEKGASV
ncbi:MAG: hypothetical protein KDB07_08400 [Planctomycetes bacterium]|nr:hypothetical protein [Planctomycetota bacterium]